MFCLICSSSESEFRVHPSAPLTRFTVHSFCDIAINSSAFSPYSAILAIRFWRKSSMAEMRRAERLYFGCRLIRYPFRASNLFFMDDVTPPGNPSHFKYSAGLTLDKCFCYLRCIELRIRFKARIRGSFRPCLVQDNVPGDAPPTLCEHPVRGQLRRRCPTTLKIWSFTSKCHQRNGFRKTIVV